MTLLNGSTSARQDILYMGGTFTGWRKDPAETHKNHPRKDKRNFAVRRLRMGLDFGLVSRFWKGGEKKNGLQADWQIIKLCKCSTDLCTDVEAWDRGQEPKTQNQKPKTKNQKQNYNRPIPRTLTPFPSPIPSCSFLSPQTARPPPLFAG